MKFPNLRKTSNFQCKFSPNGQFLVSDFSRQFLPVGLYVYGPVHRANSYSHGLNIYDAENGDVVYHFTCADVVDLIEWSTDSKYILTATFKRSLVQVWSVEEPDWTCKIDEGSLGLVGVFWSPDGRHILTIAKFHLRITIWSLVNKCVSYIKYPKTCSQGLCFSHDGKYMALLERRDCKDHVSLFLCSSWDMVTHFEPETKDAVGLLWSPGGDALCLWENILENYKIMLYSLSGQLIASFSAYQWSLGIKSVQWSPTSQFLAIGSYDQKVRILNHITWKPIIEFEHPTSVTTNRTTVFLEIESNPLETDFSILTDLSTLETKCYYENVTSFPCAIPNQPPEMSKANPKYGVGTLLYSASARYLATINDNMPTVVWIWDMDNLEITHCLIQKQPVKHISWNSREPHLALCTANQRIYLWSPEQGSKVLELPTESTFQTLQVQWHPAGKNLILISKDSSLILSV